MSSRTRGFVFVLGLAALIGLTSWLLPAPTTTLRQRYGLPERAERVTDLGRGWIAFTLDGHRYLYHPPTHAEPVPLLIQVRETDDMEDDPEEAQLLRFRH